MDGTVIPERVPGDIRPDGSANPSTAANANENKLDWKSTASATAKLLLRGVRGSAGAFGPLKVAGQSWNWTGVSPFPDGEGHR